MKTAYVVGYTGGFDWYFNPDYQESAYQRTIKETESMEDYHVIKFTYKYDASLLLLNYEVTNLIDIYFNSDEFDEAHPKWHIKEYLRPEIKRLEKKNFDLRMELKTCRKVLEYNNITCITS
jgi:hypothetical protein